MAMNGHPVAPMANPEDRDALASRVLPQMTFSKAENPLTAPLPPPTVSTAAEKAAARFQVEGNASFQNLQNALVRSW